MINSKIEQITASWVDEKKSFCEGIELFEN
jgi:hypothetical protein